MRPRVPDVQMITVCKLQDYSLHFHLIILLCVFVDYRGPISRVVTATQN